VQAFAVYSVENQVLHRKPSISVFKTKIKGIVWGIFLVIHCGGKTLRCFLSLQMNLQDPFMAISALNDTGGMNLPVPLSFAFFFISSKQLFPYFGVLKT